METTLLSFNGPNFVTVVLMAVIGIVLLRMGATWVNNKRGAGNA